MTAAVGLFTLRLVRVAIGPIRLGDLAQGKWRELAKSETRLLTQSQGYNAGLTSENA
jgi:23S rRNA pseudouridine2457 synthase